MRASGATVTGGGIVYVHYRRGYLRVGHRKNGPECWEFLIAGNAGAVPRTIRSDDLADGFLARLCEPKHPAFEFAFGLEPIVQLTA
jgi:hypothetical protein